MWLFSGRMHDPDICHPATFQNCRAVTNSLVNHKLMPKGIALNSIGPEASLKTEQTVIFDCVPVGRPMALPEAEQVEFADQFLKARVAAEQGHVW